MTIAAAGISGDRACAARRGSCGVPAAGGDEGAVDACEGDRGGAAGGAAERLGVLEAGSGARHDLELRIRRRHGGGSGPELPRVAVGAAEAVDCRIRSPMLSSHDLCFH